MGYDNWLVNTAIACASVSAVVVSVLLHYEGLVMVSRGLARLGVRRRTKVLYGIGSVLGLHILEVWIFGFAYWLLLQIPDSGMVGGGPLQLLDAVYSSVATFTTVGYGDLAPVGPIRLLAGTEALTGFVLIAWSASFTYLEMEQFWSAR